jgi:hypothetical protein
VTLRDKGFEVIELNPYPVKTARAQLGQARIKTDLRDFTHQVQPMFKGSSGARHLARS